MFSFHPDVHETVFIAWLSATGVQVLYYLVVFSRLAFRGTRREGEGTSPVTIVLCARNELGHIRQNLMPVLEQRHPDFRVHVVNDCSWDDSERALEEYVDAYPRLRVVTIQENERYRHGKKFALTLGIKSAETETLLLTDADCRPASPRWAGLMTRSIRPGTDIVIGYGAYEKRKGLLNKWIRFDTVFNAMQYLSFALAGLPYMGTGRNLCYTRTLFFNNKGFARHNHLISGDDDLFINETATPRNTAVETDPDSFTYSEPATRTGTWIRQKRRHLVTAKYYKTLHCLMLGMFYVTQGLVYAGLAALLLMGYRVYAVLGIFGFRMAVQLLITGRCMKKLKEQDLLIFTPLFDLLVVLIYPILAISIRIRKVKEWK